MKMAPRRRGHFRFRAPPTPTASPLRGARHRSGTNASAVGQAGSLRGGCLPPPSRSNAPVGRLPIGRSLPSCPTTASSAWRALKLGFPALCQLFAPASTSMSHTHSGGECPLPSEPRYPEGLPRAARVINWMEVSGFESQNRNHRRQWAVFDAGFHQPA